MGGDPGFDIHRARFYAAEVILIIENKNLVKYFTQRIIIESISYMNSYISSLLIV